MYRLAYRNYSGSSNTSGPTGQVMVVNHSVDLSGGGVGVRWYELSAPAGNPFGNSNITLTQGTFAPDSRYRWMGSAAMDCLGNIGLGYSLSSSNTFPSIAVTSLPGTTTSETIRQPGSGSQVGYSRWGDYTALRIDPSDGKKFWYTNEYYETNNTTLNFKWSTAIVSFALDTSSTTVCPTYAASSGGGGGGTGGTGGNNTADFKLSAPAVTVNRSTNRSGSSTITVTPLDTTNGLSGPVTLSVSNVPSKTTASFSISSTVTTKIVGTMGTTNDVAVLLYITVDPHGPTGTFSLTVSGTDDGGNSSASASLPLTISK